LGLGPALAAAGLAQQAGLQDNYARGALGGAGRIAHRLGTGGRIALLVQRVQILLVLRVDVLVGEEEGHHGAEEGVAGLRHHGHHVDLKVLLDRDAADCEFEKLVRPSSPGVLVK